MNVTGIPMVTPNPRPQVRLAGGFDLLHVGHLAALDRASRIAPDAHPDLTELVVYVVDDDALTAAGRTPMVTQADRIELVRALRGVAGVAAASDPADALADRPTGCVVLVTDELGPEWVAVADGVLSTETGVGNGRRDQPSEQGESPADPLAESA